MPLKLDTFVIHKGTDDKKGKYYPRILWLDAKQNETLLWTSPVGFVTQEEAENHGQEYLDHVLKNTLVCKRST